MEVPGPAGAARPGGACPRLCPASLPASLLFLPPSRRGCSLLPPQRLPRLTARGLRCRPEMQLAEEGKALPGRRPSPSREMSAMRRRRAAQPCPARAWSRDGDTWPTRLVFSVVWRPQGKFLFGVLKKFTFFAPRSLVILQVSGVWGWAGEQHLCVPRDHLR